MPGKHPDTLQVESFLLQFCPGSTPIRYNLTRLYIVMLLMLMLSSFTNSHLVLSIDLTITISETHV